MHFHRDNLAICAAGSSTLSDIASLHRTCFGDGFMGFMGSAYLCRFYGFMGRDENGVVLVAREQEMVVGFVGGVADCPRFFRRFRQHCFFGVLQDVLRLSCTRPAYLPRVINLFKRSRSGVRYSEDAFLLALGVSPDRRRHGIAEQLLTAFGDAMRVKGVNAYALTTETCGNEAANRFYQKQGLQLVRSFEPPGREVFVNEYRCDLRSKAGRLGMEP